MGHHPNRRVHHVLHLLSSGGHDARVIMPRVAGTEASEKVEIPLPILVVHVDALSPRHGHVRPILGETWRQEIVQMGVQVVECQFFIHRSILQ